MLSLPGRSINPAKPRPSSRLLRLPANACIAIPLALIFLARWLLSDRLSYWFDELLSVATYGVEQPNVIKVVKYLATRSIHPPLYQAILFYWMKLFGDGEMATRFLSNLYVTGAALCLYFTVRKAAGQRRALMAAVLFSLMYMPFYYAMETRSYGQTLFLCSLSSLALLHFMRVLATTDTWRGAFYHRSCVVLVLSNFALLMTHYYNVFFLVSQGLFLLTWTTRRLWPEVRREPARLAAELARSALPLILPLALLLVAWGPVMARSYQKRSDEYVVSGAVADPLTAFWQQAVRPNFGLVPWLCLVSCAALLFSFYGARALAGYRGRRAPPVGLSTLAGYALFMALGPFVIAFALFSLSGHERYIDRYFAFTAPFLSIMLVLSLEQAVVLAGRATRSTRLARNYLAWSALYTLAAAAMVLPGTYDAAMKGKADWRGIAKMIVDTTKGDPTHKYIIYASGFTSQPSINYYFRRLGSSIKTRAIVKLAGEKANKLPFEQDLERIAQHDFLVVTFTHRPAKDYPNTLAWLSSHYQPAYSVLERGHGFVVYRVKPDS